MSKCGHVTVTLLLFCVSHVVCVKNLFSETSAFHLIENFQANVYDSNTYPNVSTLSHTKWEQQIVFPAGVRMNIDWIFHSSKSMQDRVYSSTCEVTTWVISVDYDQKPLGQVTCLWSMLLGNHCNHVCQFPVLPSYRYVNFVDLLNVANKSEPIFFYVHSRQAVSANDTDTATWGNNIYPTDNVAVYNKDKYYSQEEGSNAMGVGIGTEETETVQRHLRTYSDSNEWTPLSSNKITSFSGIANENFGSSVSISGDYMAVGAIGTKDFEGRVLVYQRFGVTLWKQEYFALMGNRDYSNRFFGWCLSLSGDAVAVGAYQTMHVQEEQRTSVGAVYIYLRVSAGWINEAFLQVERENRKDNKNDNKNNNINNQLVYDHFGWAVSLHHSTLVVGAYGDSTLGTSAGAAYIFDRYDHAIYGWSQSQQLLPCTTDDSSYAAFGWSVAIYSNVTAVGAYGHSSGDRVFIGAVYIFQRIGASSYANAEESGHGRLQSWTQTTILLPADGGSNDYFGWDVAIWQNLLAVGSHDWASQDTDDTPTGAVYTYATGAIESPDRYITTIYQWHFDQKLVPFDVTTRYFGNSIAMTEKTLLIGSFGDEYSVTDVGQAFIYTAVATNDQSWSNTGDDDGDDEVSGDKVNGVVKQSQVESGWSGSNIGVSRRPLYTWTRVATLVPNTTETGIDFGFSVDIDCVTAVVGAVRADGQAADSGAAFVFIMSNTKFEYPMSERTYLALVSFLPVFFLSVFCIIGSTMACLSLKTNKTFLSLMDCQDDNEDDGTDDEDDEGYGSHGGDWSSHSSSSEFMDSSVYSETELIRNPHVLVR